MTHGGRRAKGRRLQVEIAETLSVELGLTIEAAFPTKPGTRSNGAVYVAEGGNPDLRVRASGQPGVDVALLTEKAKSKVCIKHEAPLTWKDNELTIVEYPIWFEAKNCESFSLDSSFWRTGENKFIENAMDQAKAGIGKGKMYVPVVVVSKNRFPTLVAVEREYLQWLAAFLGVRDKFPGWYPEVITKNFVLIPFSSFVAALKLT